MSTAALAAAVVRCAAERGVTVASAESCTGGLVGAALTGVPGSSAAFGYGVVAYANAAKAALLGVDPALIERHGAVSGEVASAMAVGVARLSGAHAAVSVTGIAGPGGGSADKPVGLVWFGLASGGEVRAERHVFGDQGRDGVRARAVDAALTLLLGTL